MNRRKVAGYVACLVALLVAADWLRAQEGRPVGERHLIYASLPGNGTNIHLGGVGVVVFDASNDWKFVKRIPTWDYTAIQGPEPIRGIAASAATGMLYLSTTERLAAFDLVTDKKVWEIVDEWGYDQMSLSLDGKTLYVPSDDFGRPEQTFQTRLYVIEAATGKLITEVLTPETRGGHNSIVTLDGSKVFMSGKSAQKHSIIDTKTHKVVGTIGPWTGVERVFTINGAATLMFSNMVGLLGFEVADIRSGKMLHRVEVPGYAFSAARVRGHGTPSHGVALSPDEKEIWVVDDPNEHLHVFDSTTMPPKYKQSIELRAGPTWVTWGIDGKYVYPSTGDVIDAATKKVVHGLTDEYGRALQTEKLVEIAVAGGKVVRAHNRFGVGYVRNPPTNN